MSSVLALGVGAYAQGQIGRITNGGVTGRAGGQNNVVTQDTMPDQLIVKFKPGSQAVEMQVHAAAGTQVIQRNAAINWTLVRVPQGKTKAQIRAVYGKYPNYVTNVTDNPIVKKFDTVPNDPDYPKQWGLPRIEAPKMWDRSTGATSTVVAILDTGVDIDHPDLIGNLLPGSDPGDNDNNPNDDDGHGTHCAGIAGAVGNNAVGVAGIGWKNKILPVKVFGSVGGFAVATGITYATDHGAHVISMSLGVSDFQALRDAVDYAWSKNVLMIAAAGNDGNQVVNLPAGLDKVMAVANSLPNDARNPGSTYGSWVDVAAPGTDIYSTLPDGKYDYATGTSMACPLVAGLAGVIFAEGGITFTNQQVWDIITQSSDKPPVVDYVKHGRVNAWKAISMIQQYQVVTKDPVSVSKMYGTSMVGGVNLLGLKDSKSVIVQSALLNATGATAGVVVDWTITDLPVYVEPQLRFAARTEIPATLMVFLYNNTTKNWDFVRSGGTKNAASDLSVALPSAMGNYITAQGRIRALVRTHIPVTRGRSVASYRLQLDQAVFEGNVKIN